MRKLFLMLSVLLAFGMSSCDERSQVVITLSPSDQDMTEQLRAKLDGVEAKNLQIVFEPGVYYAKPDYATERYCAITNHGNGVKKILFPLAGFESVEVVGNGAKLVCHGQLFPFLFEKNESVKVTGLTIDWDVPFTFLAEVLAVNPEEGWRDVRPMTDGFSWKLNKGQIEYPNIDGFNYTHLGSTLPFEKETKRVVRGAIDTHSQPTRVERKAKGVLRIHEKSRYYPPVGSMLSSKGNREDDRYAPAFDFKECQNVVLENVTIHHALGMAFLFERSEGITLRGCKVVVEEGSPRMIASTADATHFANCKGDILIDGCRFENMLDDGTNVHGTYVVIDKVTGTHSLVASLIHFEQMGFKFAEAGDEMWFIKAPSPERQEVNMVTEVRVINEKYMELTFADALPADLKVGDVVENKTWNPTFTMRNCTIQNNRARSIVLKTPLKTLIENNYFSSMMSAVLFRGETYFWFESGAVEDVVIRNNYFKNAGDCGTKHAVLYITPLLGKAFDATALYDRNIVFENNVINTYLPRVVIADRVEGLVVRGNKITRNTEGVAPFPNDPMYELVNCKNTTITGNTYHGEAPARVMESDERSAATLTFED